MPNKDRNIPKRRFKEFENADAWELRKLGEVAEMYSGGTPSVGRKELYDGNIPFIRSAEINSHNTELFISELGLSNSSAKMVSEGTLLYALYGATSGEVGLSKISGAINQAILAIIPSIGYSSSFLLQWLKREKNNIIEKYLQGGQGNLSGAIVKDFFILFPTLSEQEAIGTFFSTLDRHITLHQRKLDKLKCVKQAYLSEMFPAEGERVPKRRFPGFTDDWELRKLGEVAEIITGTTPSTFDEENYGGKRLFVSPVDIQDNRYITETLTTLTEKGHLLGRELRPGATLFVSIGSTIGKVAQLKSFATSNQQINAVISDDKIDDDFIFTGLEKKSAQIKNLSSQQAVPIINKSTFSKIEFEFPTLPEQEAIGTFFSTLDRHITLHQRKLEKLKNLKKALLNELFV
ncbi:TPA: restriction endonuclease subunit S [Streptococcus suis]|nr:restriction endonuclease subunit S [Streptococcus suis]